MLYLGVAIFLAIGFIAWIFTVVGHFFDKADQKFADRTTRFVMHNEVEGSLFVQDEEIRTYTNGYVVYDKQVGIDFYHSPINKQVMIIDITFHDQSLFAYAPKGSSYREKADYALLKLKELASQKKIARDLVFEVEQIIKDVDKLQHLMNLGHVYKPVGTEDYAWKY